MHNNNSIGHITEYYLPLLNIDIIMNNINIIIEWYYWIISLNNNDDDGDIIYYEY